MINFGESTDTAISYFVPNCPAFREAYKKNEAAFLEKLYSFAGAREVLEKIVAGGGRNFWSLTAIIKFWKF